MRNIDMAILQFKENRQTPMIPKNTPKKTLKKMQNSDFQGLYADPCKCGRTRDEREL